MKTFNINRPLLPVKGLLFSYFGGVHSVFPFINLLMLQRGLTIPDITIINSLLPVAGLFGPPIAGLCADKLGRYKPVAFVCLGLTTLLFSCMVMVPFYNSSYRPIQANISQTDKRMLSMSIEKCRPPSLQHPCGYDIYGNITLSNCSLKCLQTDNSNGIVTMDDADNRSMTILRSIDDAVIMQYLINSNVSYAESDTNTCKYDVASDRIADWHNSTTHNQNCSLQRVVCNFYQFSKCKQVIGSFPVTFGTTFALRIGAQMAMASSYALVDAVALSAVHSQKGKYGRQRVWAHVAQAIFPPTAGAIMDAITFSTGEPAYYSAFILMVQLMVMAGVILWQITLTEDPMMGSLFSNIRKLVLNLESTVLFIVSFFYGFFPGFVAVFLSIYLKKLGGSMQLIGLTSTAASLASIPLVFCGDAIVKWIGHVNILATGFFLSSLRFIAYSIITDPWWAIPVETLKAFIQNLCWIALVTYAAKIAPKGMLSTVVGTTRAIAYGLGRGSGILVGGMMIHRLKYPMTFRIFAMLSCGVGIAYLLLHYFWFKRAFSNKLTRAGAGSDSKQDDGMKNGIREMDTIQPMLQKAACPVDETPIPEVRLIQPTKESQDN